MSSILLSGDDRLCAATAAWFSASAPPAAPRLHWHAKVDAEVGDAQRADHASDVVVDELEDGRVRIVHPAGVSATIDAHTARVEWQSVPDLEFSLDAALQSVGMMALIFALRRAGWHHLHAATVESPSGDGWLLVGPSGSGKSTTAALLAKAGWRVGGDDAAFLALTGSEVVAHPWRSPIGLRSDTLEVVGLAASTVGESKTRQAAQTFGGETVTQITPRSLALLTFGGNASDRSSVRRMEAMTALIAQGAWEAMELRFSDDYLGVLEKLVQQVSAVRVQIGRDLGAEVAPLFNSSAS